MNSLLRVLQKPEYFYNPKQFFKRLGQIVQKRPMGESSFSFLGNNFAYLPGEDIGRALHTFGLYDLSVSEALWLLAEKGNSVCDVGANIGYFSRLLSSRVGEQGKVYSFEPNPQVLPLLQKNIEQFSSIDVHAIGLSDSNSKLDLYAPENYDDNKGLASLEKAVGARIAQVEVRRMDDLNVAPVLIKIDIEGHELNALKGASKVLKSVQHIVFEDHDLEKNGVKAFLKENGFTVYYLQKNFSFLRLQNTDSKYSVSRTEPPNFLATRWPAKDIHDRFGKMHWAFLQALSDYK